MPSPGLELQKRIFETLTAALAPTKVYDGAPQGAAFPYVTIGESFDQDWSTMTGFGEEISLRIHVWSRYPGWKEAKDIMAAIKAALNNAALAPAGQNLVQILFESAEHIEDQDGVTRHGVQTYRALTYAA